MAWRILMSSGRGCLRVSPHGSVVYLNYLEAKPAANITSTVWGGGGNNKQILFSIATKD